MSFYVSTATFFLLHCDEWDRIVALPRHKFVTGATLLQLHLAMCGIRTHNISGDIIVTDWISSCKSNYNMITTTTAPHFLYHLLLQTGNLVRLSQQELMDCSWGEGNNACDGGEDFRAYQFIMKNGGITTEEQYGPYLAQVRILIKVAVLEMKIRIYLSESNS